jgi:hypothetical protein
MLKHLLKCAFVLWAVAAAGCGKPEDSAHAVSWYQQHNTEMQAKVAWCMDDVERQRTPECLNAVEAKRRSLLGSQKDLAPIDWGAASTAKP